jgi:hypothetical protein
MSTTHAAWDAGAVHGVHAMHSLGKLGAARANRPELSGLLLSIALAGRVRITKINIDNPAAGWQ